MYCLFTSLEIAGGDSLGDCPMAAATVQHSWASVRRRGVIESIMMEEEGLPSLNLTVTEKKKKKGHAGRKALYKHEKFERARLFLKLRRGGIEGGLFFLRFRKRMQTCRTQAISGPENDCTIHSAY